MISVVLFSLVAVLSFCVWAFGSSLFPSELTMYAGCAIVFLGLGGISFAPGRGWSRKEATRFALAFAAGFLAYAAAWTTAWFLIGRTFGEITGSFLGLAAFACILGRATRWNVSLVVATSVLFLFHTLGYYAGGFAYEALQNRGPAGVDLPLSPAGVTLVARLSWGVGYGVGLGLGIDRVLYLSRQSSQSPSTQI